MTARACATCGASLEGRGHQAKYCRPCRAERKAAGIRKWRAENKERVRQLNRDWQEKNAEYVKNYSKRRYEQNRANILAAQRRYRAENLENIRAARRRYYAENAEKVSERGKRYRAKNQEKLRAKSAQYYRDNRQEFLEKQKRRSAENPHWERGRSARRRMRRGRMEINAILPELQAWIAQQMRALDGAGADDPPTDGEGPMSMQDFDWDRFAPSQASEMTTETLVKVMQAGLDRGAEALRAVCVAICELRVRNAAVPAQLPMMFRLPWAEDIAQGRLSARAALAVGSDALLLKRLAALRDTGLQVRLAEGERVPVAVRKRDGRVATVHMRLSEMTSEQFARAVDPDEGPVPVATQIADLPKAPPRRRARAPRPRGGGGGAVPAAEADKPVVDVCRESGELIVSGLRVAAADLREAVLELAPALRKVGVSVKPVVRVPVATRAVEAGAPAEARH